MEVGFIFQAWTEQHIDCSCVVNSYLWGFWLPSQQPAQGNTILKSQVLPWKARTKASLGSNYHLVFKVTFALPSTELKYEAVSEEQRIRTIQG